MTVVVVLLNHYSSIKVTLQLNISVTLVMSQKFTIVFHLLQHLTALLELHLVYIYS